MNMIDDEDDGKYPSNQYGVTRTSENVENSYVENEDDDNNDVGDEVDIENGEEDEDDDDDGGNGVQRIGKDDYEDGDEYDEDDDEDYGNLQRHPKKRKLKTLLSSYEFAPRVPTPSSSVPKLSYGGRNPLTDWTEHETFVLLDAWGDRFLKQGRKSLRSEEWQEVAEKVSQQSSIERTDTQCRNRLDTLKKKYKKEKIRPRDSPASKWVYFAKMDVLLSSHPQQSGGLSCGVDSGEFVFMNPKVYLNRSNGLDEMRDSPGNSDSGEDGSDGLPPKKTKNGHVSRGSFKLLADSIHKFSNIYEKMEKNKRQQMVKLEEMRVEIHRDLELQKNQILERAQAEITRIRQGGDEDNEVSAENVSD